MPDPLLTREQFRSAVFERDHYLCVVCGKPAVDAHHIIERKLWDDGGYYLNNGVSVCEQCHIKAEGTLIPCSTLRERALIMKVLLPPGLDPDGEYDKWGNTVDAKTGYRIPGPLFYEESTQRALRLCGMDKFFFYHV